MWNLSSDCKVNLNGKKIFLSEKYHEITCLIWSEQEEMLYTGGRDNKVRRWMIKGLLGVVCDEIVLTKTPAKLLVFPVSDLLVVKDDKGEIVFYKMSSGEWVMNYNEKDEGEGRVIAPFKVYERGMMIVSVDFPLTRCIRLKI